MSTATIQSHDTFPVQKVKLSRYNAGDMYEDKDAEGRGECCQGVGVSQYPPHYEVMLFKSNAFKQTLKFNI